MYDNTISLQPLIITVEENETVLDDTAYKLGFEAVSNISSSLQTTHCQCKTILHNNITKSHHDAILLYYFLKCRNKYQSDRFDWITVKMFCNEIESSLVDEIMSSAAACIELLGSYWSYCSSQSRDRSIFT
jgi:hypothetical protein